MYQQFALTIAISVLLSAFSALSLSPALAAMLLKPRQADARAARRVLRRLQQGLRRHDQGLRRRLARCSCGASFLTIVLVGGVVVGAGFFGKRAAGRLHPRRGPGHLRRQRAAPARRPRSSAPSAVLAQVEEILGRDRGHRVLPDDRRLRRGHEHLPAELRDDLRAPEAVGGAPRRGAARARHHGRRCSASSRSIPEAIAFPFNIPTISGFGASAGFNFLLQDRSGTLSVAELGEQSRDVPRGRARSGPSSATCSPRSIRPTRRSRSTSTATRRASSACR